MWSVAIDELSGIESNFAVADSVMTLAVHTYTCMFVSVVVLWLKLITRECEHTRYLLITMYTEAWSFKNNGCYSLPLWNHLSRFVALKADLAIKEIKS